MSWPSVPLPWASTAYHTQKYRAGYRTAYADQPVKIFRDPRTLGAKAYFEGFSAGTTAREAGILHEQAIPVPEQYTSGDARKAYRAGHLIAQEVVRKQLPIQEWIELYSEQRALAADNPTWGSGGAFDDGWRAGALSVGVLSPPLPNEKPQEIIHQDPAINGRRS